MLVQFRNNWIQKIPLTAKSDSACGLVQFWLSSEFFSSNYFQIGQHVVLLHILISIIIVNRVAVNRGQNQIEIEIKKQSFCILEVKHPESSSSSSG